MSESPRVLNLHGSPLVNQLALLELADQDSAPAVGGPDDGGVHQLQHFQARVHPRLVFQQV
jgi:hypothetical protein